MRRAVLNCTDVSSSIPMEIITLPVGRDINELIRRIKAFQHVRVTKGAEACSAGWEPGKKVLKPGPELVGNVWKEWNPAKDLA